MSMLLVLVLLT